MSGKRIDSKRSVLTGQKRRDMIAFNLQRTVSLTEREAAAGPAATVVPSNKRDRNADRGSGPIPGVRWPSRQFQAARSGRGRRRDGADGCAREAAEDRPD